MPKYKITTFQELEREPLRTKIITTIGPNTQSVESIKKFYRAGMNTIRLNFSHGTHEDHAQKIKWARQAEHELGRPISVMLDTKGPEVRVGKMVNDEQYFARDQKVIIFCDPHEYETRICGQDGFTISHDLSQDLIGQSPASVKILVDDGKWELMVKKIDADQHLVIATAKNEYYLKSNKRINVPGINLSLQFLSDRDRQDIKFGLRHHVDYIAASFVCSSADVNAIRSLVSTSDYQPQIIAKIESAQGIKNIDEIIEASDGIMIARGDLGLEVAYFDIPYWEKVIIQKCRKFNRFVIVATQMLESMTKSPTPSRAEATDIYFAVESGADAVMLSGETASGDFPEEAINTMRLISLRASKEFYSKASYANFLANVPIPFLDLRTHIARELAKKTADGSYPVSIVLSNTGQLLKAVSRFRPNTAIIAVTSLVHDYRAYGCWHSISPYLVTEVDSLKQNWTALNQFAINKCHLPQGQTFLFVHRESLRPFKAE